MRYSSAVTLMCFFLILFSIPMTWIAEAQTKPDDPWGPLRMLVGHWEGSIDGRLGTGFGIRDYEFILEDNFLMFRHASVREPQDKSPQGDHHRELSVFSFDSERKKIVLREFMVEGFVIQYVCNVASPRTICVTEQVESGPGMRARLTLEINNPYRFEETFELAGQGEELAHYFTNRWTRRPSLP
jgi:hypothetical protein